MAAKFNSDSGAALLFLLLYICVFLWILSMRMRGNIQLRSRWSILLLHVAVRMASQACGIGFTVLSFSNINVFLAFLVLSAEGYFTLVLCAFRFLITWHQNHSPSGVSWLEPKAGTNLSTSQVISRIIASLFFGPFALLFYRGIMDYVHVFLVLGNAVIIAGSPFLASANFQEFDSAATQRDLRLGRDLRLSGQSVFLAITVALLICLGATTVDDIRERTECPEGTAVFKSLCALWSAFAPQSCLPLLTPFACGAALEPGPLNGGLHYDGGTVAPAIQIAHGSDNNYNASKVSLCGPRVDKTLLVLLITWIPLIVRSIYGVLQSADLKLSYFEPENYGPHGFSNRFTVVEYLMGVCMEWAACVLLCATFYTSRNKMQMPAPLGGL
uniref:Uncharacterized protein n=1 Tax=Mycena chlorophos TaxID=658473 RepID=A0ABQ0LJP9_MYCCL|nr:predicted protein [Mycena chlorophos]